MPPPYEWDIYKMHPGTTAPEYLATLYEGYAKSIRIERDGTGSGQFSINRSSPNCTEAILAPGNLVKVRVPEIDDGYLFAFFIETGDFALISSDEEGGERLDFGGRGALAYLEYARAWSESFVTGGDDPVDNVWRAYAAGTGNRPGQILRRLLEEFQHADRPQKPLPHLTIDFDYDDDSTADPWDVTSATGEFSYQVGEDGLAIVLRLLETGIVVQMDHDFSLHAYNPENFGRDLTGTVRFDRGINIATELKRQMQQKMVSTHMLVAGEKDRFARAVLPGAADRVTKEGYIAAFGEGASALVGIGRAELAAQLQSSELVIFPIANRRTAVSLSDPITVGAVIGPDADDQYYLPGPAGTNGDFWVGDLVRIHTGTDAFDYNEVDATVMAITIGRDDDNHELIVIPELQTEQITPCAAELSWEFAASSGLKEGFWMEIAGAELPVADSERKSAQFSSYDPDLGDMAVPGGLTDAILIAGYMMGNQTDSDGPHPPPNKFSSTDLTIIHQSMMGVGEGDLNPHSVVGYRIVTAAGTYGTALQYLGGGLAAGGIWWGAEGIVLPGDGTGIEIVQYGSIDYIDGSQPSVVITPDNPPIEGNVIVVWIVARVGDLSVGLDIEEPGSSTWYEVPGGDVRQLGYGSGGGRASLFAHVVECA